MENLRDKHFKTVNDLEEIERALRDITQKRSDLFKLKDEVISFYVFDENISQTEEDLKRLQIKVDSEIRNVKDFCSHLKEKYNKLQQLVPSDIVQELNQLELLAEAISGAMEEKSREFKKARTIRTDYTNDVDEVQTWIKDAELKVRDRATEPHLLNEHLQQVQSEMASVSDKLEKLTRNGKTIIEKTRDDDEKELIQSTINNLAEQLAQVKSWLEERRQQVGETLDAWQRFLTLYQTVMLWVQEKKVFLQEQLYLSTLQEAKQKLHDYSVSICNCFKILVETKSVI